MKNLDKKTEKLRDMILSTQGAAIAFSGSVASSVLLKFAHDLLKDKTIAITVNSPLFPSYEFQEASTIASEIGVKHSIIGLGKNIVETIKENTKLRCYYCKREHLLHIKKEATTKGFHHIMEGLVYSGNNENRHKMRALSEFGIVSPFIEAGFTMQDILELGRDINLEISEYPQQRCLASRIVHKNPITIEKFRMIESAEMYLKKLEIFNSKVYLGNGETRLEVNHADIRKVVDNSDRINYRFRKIGIFDLKVELKDLDN